MLTPFGYYKFCLVGAFRKRKSTLVFSVFCLIIACVILFTPPSQGGEAAGDVSHMSVDGVLLQDPYLAVEMVERKLTPTPTFPLSLTPTPLSVPDTGVVWNQKADGAYLWESPDGSILTMLPNGSVLKFLGERQAYGNVHWVKVQSPDGEGWISWTHVYRVSIFPVAYIAHGEWTYLRDQPRGRVQQVLTVGTPILRILDSQELDGHSWVQIELLNGAVGWTIEALLVDEQSPEELP